MMFWFYSHNESTGTFLGLFRNLVRDGNRFKKFGEPVVDKVFINIFFSAAQGELYLEAMACFQELFCLFGFHDKIMRASTKAYANAFDLYFM